MGAVSMDGFALLRVALLGGMLTVVLQCLWNFKAGDDKRFALLAGALAVCGCGVLVGRLLDSGEAMPLTGSLLGLCFALLYIPVGLLLALEIAEKEPGRTTRCAIAVGFVLPAIPLLELLASHELILREAVFEEFYALREEPFGLLLPPLLIVVGLLAARDLRAARFVDSRAQRLGGYIIACAFVIGGVNDLLVSHGVVVAPRLLDLAIGVQLCVASVVQSSRVGVLSRHLRWAVRERTAELEKAQRGLTRSLEAVRSLVDAIPDSVFVCRGTRLVLVNPAATEFLEEDADALRERELTDFVEADERSEISERLLELSEANPRLSAREARFQLGDGRQRTGEMVAVRVSFQGAPATVVIVRDVSERLAMQRKLLQADRLASLGTLSAGVAHEVNNPLSYVFANLQFAHEELGAGRALPADELLELVEDALEGADRVRGIILDLKTFSRAEEEVIEPTDVRGSIDVAIKMVGNEIRHRAELEIDCPEEIPRVRANAAQLNQVLINLLTNAAHAVSGSERPAPKIRVSARRTEEGGVALGVEDNGPGIPQPIRNRIFDPFFTTKPVGMGSGLGLFVCQGIIQSFGGALSLASEEGEGTRAAVELRSAEETGAAGSEIDEAEGTRTAAETRPEAPRVLVVDDEATVARSIARMLKECSVTIATSGEEAIEELGASSYDAVVCDLMMPGASGMDVYGASLERRPELEGRFVFVTGGAFTREAAEFLERVSAHRLEKPIDFGALRRIVAEIAGRS